MGIPFAAKRNIQCAGITLVNARLTLLNTFCVVILITSTEVNATNLRQTMHTVIGVTMMMHEWQVTRMLVLVVLDLIFKMAITMTFIKSITMVHITATTAINRMGAAIHFIWRRVLAFFPSLSLVSQKVHELVFILLLVLVGASFVLAVHECNVFFFLVWARMLTWRMQVLIFDDMLQVLSEMVVVVPMLAFAVACFQFGHAFYCGLRSNWLVHIVLQFKKVLVDFLSISFTLLLSYHRFGPHFKFFVKGLRAYHFVGFHDIARDELGQLLSVLFSNVGHCLLCSNLLLIRRLGPWSLLVMFEWLHRATFWQQVVICHQESWHHFTRLQLFVPWLPIWSAHSRRRSPIWTWRWVFALIAIRHDVFWKVRVLFVHAKPLRRRPWNAFIKLSLSSHLKACTIATLFFEWKIRWRLQSSLWWTMVMHDIQNIVATGLTLASNRLSLLGRRLGIEHCNWWSQLMQTYPLRSWSFWRKESKCEADCITLGWNFSFLIKVSIHVLLHYQIVRKSKAVQF